MLTDDWVKEKGEHITSHLFHTRRGVGALNDQGFMNFIKARVTFTDDAGNEESLTSAPTDAVVMGWL